MSELKFNSQICTTKEQSQRLLELGLKPETADMAWVCVTKEGLTQWVMTLNTTKNKSNIDIPAWSLHRLIEICSKNYYIFNINVHKRDLYGFIINTFEHLKEQGKIDKDFL